MSGVASASRYHINVFWSDDDQCWIADVPDFRFCSVHGETPRESGRRAGNRNDGVARDGTRTSNSDPVTALSPGSGGLTRYGAGFAPVASVSTSRAEVGSVIRSDVNFALDLNVLEARGLPHVSVSGAAAPTSRRASPERKPEQPG